MNFVDTATITVKSGDGGNGHISFRREKFVEKGGPDGGGGGKGGNIVLLTNRQLGTLLDFKYKRKYLAIAGKPGGKNGKTGKSGPDTIIQVPLGTVVRNKVTGEQIADLDKDNLQIVLAKGGKGGRGNQDFATSTLQVPRKAELGVLGIEFELEFELKLLADIGLVGFPNAGKSTLISVMSAAKPKIADYPFTTLVPNLGVVRAGEGRSYTMADIPGLIEGAHTGKGLGHQFLRHVERTAVLVFMVDCTSEDPERDLQLLRTELHKYDAAMTRKEWLVCLTKTDMLPPEELEALRESAFVKDHKAMVISAITGSGIGELTEYLWGFVERSRQEIEE